MLVMHRSQLVERLLQGLRIAVGNLVQKKVQFVLQFVLLTLVMHRSQLVERLLQGLRIAVGNLVQKKVQLVR
jgi:TRAP-type mannitol/chloroaromatic compound transport system permease large subunit